jgi:hypothetical protein
VTPRFLLWSLRAYRNLLILYPDDLRRDFGPEMLEAFEYDLSVECAARSVKGVIRVWCITLREAIKFGHPAWLQVPSVAVPVLSAAAVIVSQSPLLIMTIGREAPLRFHPGDATPLDTLYALALDAVVAALTSFVAVYPWERASLISLDIVQPGLAASEVNFDGNEVLVPTLDLN